MAQEAAPHVRAGAAASLAAVGACLGLVVEGSAPAVVGGALGGAALGPLVAPEGETLLEKLFYAPACIAACAAPAVAWHREQVGWTCAVPLFILVAFGALSRALARPSA